MRMRPENQTCRTIAIKAMSKISSCARTVLDAFAFEEADHRGRHDASENPHCRGHADSIAGGWEAHCLTKNVTGQVPADD